MRTPASPKTCLLCWARRVRRLTASWNGRGGRQAFRCAQIRGWCRRGLQTSLRKGGGHPLALQENTTHAEQPAVHHHRARDSRIGPNRELKRHRRLLGRPRVRSRSRRNRRGAPRHLDSPRRRRIDSIPVNTFSYYDQVLDTAVMLDALPARVAGTPTRWTANFAAARGNADVTPLEMTKRFGHELPLLVPEIGPDTTFALKPEKVLAEVAQAHGLGNPGSPGHRRPITFLTLAKAVDGAPAPITRIDDILPAYFELLDRLVDAGGGLVQFDEPLAGHRRHQRSARAGRGCVRAPVCGDPSSGAAGGHLLRRSGCRARRTGPHRRRRHAIDLVEGDVAAVAAVPELANKLVVAGLVDGRNIWRTDLDHALGTLAPCSARPVRWPCPMSCSDSARAVQPGTGKPHSDDNLRGWLAFADERNTPEVSALAHALRDGRESQAAAFDACAALHSGDQATIRACTTTKSGPGWPGSPTLDVTRGEVHRASGQPAGEGSPRCRPPRSARTRRPRQSGWPAPHCARATSTDQTKMRAEIADVIALQEKIGLDVLVHGEPERNDMVQYFAEQLDGFSPRSTAGSPTAPGMRVRRSCSATSRPQPMTVDWITYARSRSPANRSGHADRSGDHPSGRSSATISRSCRTRPTRSRWPSGTIPSTPGGRCRHHPGRRMALRELLPLRDADKPAYLNWAVRSFRLSTSGVADDMQIHTHPVLFGVR